MDTGAISFGFFFSPGFYFFNDVQARAWASMKNLIACWLRRLYNISLSLFLTTDPVTWFIYKSWNETGGPLRLLLLLVQLFCLMFVSAFEITLLACLVGGNSRGQTRNQADAGTWNGRSMVELHAYIQLSVDDVLSFFFQRFREQGGTHRQNCWHGARVTDPLAFFSYLIFSFRFMTFMCCHCKCNWIHWNMAETARACDVQLPEDFKVRPFLSFF